MRPTPWLLSATLTVACSAATDANTSASEEVRAERDARIAAVDKVFVVGCSWGLCGTQDKYACAPGLDAALLSWLQGGQGALVQWGTFGAYSGPMTSYIFVQPDGSGSSYYEAWSDVASDDCGSYCGWHRKDYPPGHFLDSSGELHFDPSAPSLDAVGCDDPKQQDAGVD